MTLSEIPQYLVFAQAAMKPVSCFRSLLKCALLVALVWAAVKLESPFRNPFQLSKFRVCWLVSAAHETMTTHKYVSPPKKVQVLQRNYNIRVSVLQLHNSMSDLYAAFHSVDSIVDTLTFMLYWQQKQSSGSLVHRFLSPLSASCPASFVIYWEVTQKNF